MMLFYFKNKFKYKLEILSFLVFVVIVYLMSFLKYTNLHSSIMDLGVFIQHISQAVTENELGRMFFGHASSWMPVYAKLYSFNLHSANLWTLLAIQSIALTLPVWLLLRYHERLVALAFVLFFPIWFNALFDFHFDHLSIPLLIGFFLLVQSKRIWWATSLAVLLAFVKEPFALQTMMCGVYIIFAMIKVQKCNTTALLAGFGLMAFGASYFYLMTEFIIPSYVATTEVSVLDSAYGWLGSSSSEMIWYILAHPVDIITEVFTTPGKVIYLVALFGALGFIPLLKPGPLIVALPILAISLLSRHKGYYELGHHYTAGLIAPMIFAFAGGLPRAKAIWQKIGVGGFRLPAKWFIHVLVTGLVAAHIVLAPSPIGRLFWSDKVWAYSYKAYIPTERDAMIKQAIADFISTDLEAVVSIQNTVNWAPLVQRRHFLLFPQGITDGQKVPFFGKGLWPPEVEWKPIIADFVVLDLKRPWFLVDKGCEWLYGKCTDEKMAAEYLDWVAKSREVMDVVFEKDGFMILARRVKSDGEQKSK